MLTEEPLGEDSVEKPTSISEVGVDVLVSQISFQDAFHVFCETIRTNEGLYIAYQSNIAMAFQDAMGWSGYKFPDLHKIANDAATNFLKSLLARDARDG